MRLFSFFSMLRICAGLRHRGSLAGMRRAYIVRCPGIVAGFFPRCCGAKDGSRNAAALSEECFFSLAGDAPYMRWTTQDADTTIQFFHDALCMRHRGGLTWLGRCTLCDALESRLVSFRGAAALKMESETLPHTAHSKGAVFSLEGDAPYMCWTTQDAAAAIQFFRDAPHLRRTAPSRRPGRGRKSARCARPRNRDWFLSAALRR